MANDKLYVTNQFLNQATADFAMQQQQQKTTTMNGNMRGTPNGLANGIHHQNGHQGLKNGLKQVRRAFDTTTNNIIQSKL